MKRSPPLKTLERTEWFRNGVQPARPGVYERDYGNGFVLFSEWTGWSWLEPARTPRKAARQWLVNWNRGTVVWRGITRSAYERAKGGD